MVNTYFIIADIWMNTMFVTYLYVKEDVLKSTPYYPSIYHFFVEFNEIIYQYYDNNNNNNNVYLIKRTY